LLLQPVDDACAELEDFVADAGLLLDADDLMPLADAVAEAEEIEDWPVFDKELRLGDEIGILEAEDALDEDAVEDADALLDIDLLEEDTEVLLASPVFDCDACKISCETELWVGTCLSSLTLCPNRDRPRDV
jgi:hypothetical protein